MTDTKNIYHAFVRAQAAFGPALKTHTNPAFRSKYADLGACIEAVIDALNSNGIALVQRTHNDERGVTVETMFLHESGESMSGGILHVPAAKQDPQGFGSALSYARRYSLMAACGIAPEDDDGNAAAQAAQQASKQPRQPAKQDKAQQVHRIVTDVKSGNAKQPAEWLASLPQQELDSIWPKIPAEVQDQLTAAWPEVAA